MSERPILVTGAAGGPQGSSGNWISRFLLERGLPVRAFVHRIDERSDELSALGAEVVQGDLLDIASVRRALAGVRRAYFAYPVQAGLLEAMTIFAVAAKDGGLRSSSTVTTSTRLRMRPALTRVITGWPSRFSTLRGWERRTCAGRPSSRTCGQRRANLCCLMAKYICRPDRASDRSRL
jgi:NmrA-like family